MQSRKRSLQPFTRFFAQPNARVSCRHLLSPTDPSLTSSEQEACELIQEGDALAKIIPTEHYLTKARGLNLRSPWDVHLKELADMDYRPNRLDIESYNPLVATTKTVEEKTPVAYTHIQATSTTLISRHLHTPLYTLFGEMDTSIGLGLVYDLKKSNVKAMFSDTDQARTMDGLFNFPDSESLAKFRKRTELYSYNDVSDLKMLIDAKDWDLCNEVVAEVNKREECLKAIIVDVMESHSKIPQSIFQRIRERHANVQERLGRDLPVICYNSQENNVKVYSKNEQHLHELRMQLEAKLSNHQSSHLPDLRLFSPEDLKYSVSVGGFVTGALDINTAHSVLHLIRTYQAQKLSAQDAKEIIKSKVETRDPHHRFVV